MDLVKEGCSAEVVQRGILLFPVQDKELVSLVPSAFTLVCDYMHDRFTLHRGRQPLGCLLSCELKDLMKAQ